VGDTLFDIQEGLNSGAWTVGVTDSSSEVGLSWGDFSSLDTDQRRRLTAPWEQKMRDAGAHEVTSTVAALPAVIEAIERRLAEGEKP
jgi:phosphonoacetaldehyde hydrolase